MQEIYNHLGQEVLKSINTSITKPISVVHLEKGVYFISYEREKPIKLIIQ